VVPLGSEPTFSQIAPVAQKIGARLETGEIKDIKAVYGRFLRGTRSEITAEEVLPSPETYEEVIFEPAPEAMVALLLKRHLQAALYAAVLENAASEHGARVAAMTAASDNATEMIRDLTMDYNKARQATITRELTEIVSSAEALA
jgi:F-type H+-transporting ATPase subunit gamma